ncbi:Abi family protein, partial [Pseudodesulfovibrio pelocollis]|uniref:Abi family protein n=1 Tax=Pseudodesulfovibrio pelocollis TaxID=3051432 RepID=UPI00255AAA1F
MEYSDPALTVFDQVLRLKQAGLIVHDAQRAERYLTYVGFHRLMKYASPFRCSWVCGFEFGTSFDNLLDLYVFDRKLRLLILDATERVEVAFRAVISNTMSLHGGPHWYLDPCYFSKDDNSSLMQDVAFATNFFSKKKQEGACKDYYSN